MVEVFKTNIATGHSADELKAALLQHFPACRINFDLDDCDRILRLEGSGINNSKVVEVFIEKGFLCEALPD